MNKKLLMPLAIASALTAGQVNADTEFSYSGFIKFDTMMTEYSEGDRSNSLIDEFYIPGLVPVSTGGAQDSGLEWDSNMRQSRFIFGTKTNLSNGSTLTSKVELDFSVTAGGDERISNSYVSRVRQAYFTYDNWLFGQAWTTFMHLNGLPETADFIGNTDGMAFARQSMIRYSTGNWQFAIENPESTLTPFGGGGRIVTDDNQMPDLVAKYSWKGDWGNASVSGMIRSLECNNPALGCDTSETSTGISAGGKFMVGDKNDVRWTFNTGSGLGRYLGLNIANGGVFNANGDIEAIDSTSYSVAYRHHWSDTWRTNIVYANFEADNDTSLTGTGVTETTRSYRLNLVQTAAKGLTFYYEIANAHRDTEGGAEGDMTRFQFTAKFAF